MTLKEIVEQLVVQFVDEIRHRVEKNVAFVELKERAEEEEK
jgi:hypothetical protein